MVLLLFYKLEHGPHGPDAFGVLLYAAIAVTCACCVYGCGVGVLCGSAAAHLLLLLTVQMVKLK